MAYAINLRIPVKDFLPFDLKTPGKLFVNVCAYSTKRRPLGEKVILHENCRDAEVYSVSATSRAPSSFDFNLG